LGLLEAFDQTLSERGAAPLLFQHRDKGALPVDVSAPPRDVLARLGDPFFQQYHLSFSYAELLGKRNTERFTFP
jgi:hypothetical protein